MARAILIQAFGLAMLVTGVRAAEQVAPRTITPGSMLLASAEGISVFDRQGTMTFGKFSTELEDGKPGEVPYGDMIYDGHELASGNFLCSSHHFVREIAPDGKTIWEFRTQPPVELKTCVPLPNHNVMTVDSERMELLQLTDRGNRIVKRIPVRTDRLATSHNRFNLLRRTDAGTYLVALRAEKVFIEVNEDGQELWRHSVPELPVVAERLANGNTLMSWLGGMIEAAPNHRVVWELKAADIPDFPVIVFAGFHRFPNGNTLIANSDWHYDTPNMNRVQVFEVTHDKRVVWTLGTDAFTGKKPGSLEPHSGFVEHRIIGLQWIDVAEIRERPSSDPQGGAAATRDK